MFFCEGGRLICIKLRKSRRDDLFVAMYVHPYIKLHRSGLFNLQVAPTEINLGGFHRLQTDRS